MRKQFFVGPFNIYLLYNDSPSTASPHETRNSPWDVSVFRVGCGLAPSGGLHNSEEMNIEEKLEKLVI
jgi:hypothetical protein